MLMIENPAPVLVHTDRVFTDCHMNPILKRSGFRVSTVLRCFFRDAVIHSLVSLSRIRMVNVTEFRFCCKLLVYFLHLLIQLFVLDLVSVFQQIVVDDNTAFILVATDASTGCSSNLVAVAVAVAVDTVDVAAVADVGVVDDAATVAAVADYAVADADSIADVSDSAADVADSAVADSAAVADVAVADATAAVDAVAVATAVVDAVAAAAVDAVAVAAVDAVAVYSFSLHPTKRMRATV